MVRFRIINSVIIFLFLTNSLLSQENISELYWNNGNTKYKQIETLDSVKDTSGKAFFSPVIKEMFFDKNGSQIQKQVFIDLYGTEAFSKIKKQLKNSDSKKYMAEDIYKNCIKSGDHYFLNLNYSKALKEYTRALEIKQKAYYPQMQCDKIRKILSAKKKNATK